MDRAGIYDHILHRKDRSIGGGDSAGGSAVISLKLKLDDIGLTTLQLYVLCDEIGKNILRCNDPQGHPLEALPGDQTQKSGSRIVSGH